MNRPWMPLYVADYLADTAHLNAAQSGAYLHLIMHYWQHGKLPTEDHALARIARMESKEWRKARPVIVPFFSDGWKHKRIEFELTEAARISEAARKGGQASARARLERSSNMSSTIVQRSLNDSTNAMGNGSSTDRQPLPSPKKEDAADAASNPEKELFVRGKVVLGEKSGGLITDLLKAKKGDVALARAAIETASTKQNPREYVGAIIRGPKNGEFKLMSGMEGVV